MINAQFLVAPEEALKFSQIWSSNGIAIPMKQEHLQFATDFANIVLRNFIISCTQASEHRKAAEQQANSLAIQGTQL